MRYLAYQSEYMIELLVLVLKPSFEYLGNAFCKFQSMYETANVLKLRMEFVTEPQARILIIQSGCELIAKQ